jgi:ADP-ribose pyrophosphatase YjhB (NUDIX family)
MTDTSFPYASTSVRAIIVRDGKILVEWLSSKSIAFLPGGTVQRGEGLVEALTRELHEEIGGANFTVDRYRGVIGHRWSPSNKDSSCLNHFYEVLLSPDSEPAARELGRSLKWIALSDPLAQRLQPPSLRSLLNLANEGLWDEVDTFDGSPDSSSD